MFKSVTTYEHRKKIINPIEYQVEIETKLKKSYYLNKSQKALYTILTWAISKNYTIHRILSTQISAKILSDILKKRKKDPSKKYTASTISRMISVLKKHSLISSERGSDKINRYYALNPMYWTNEIANERTTKKSNDMTYDLFSKEPSYSQELYNKNININSETIKYKNEKIEKNIETENQEKSETEKKLLKKAKNYIDFIKKRGWKIYNEKSYLNKILEVGEKWNFGKIGKEEEDELKTQAKQKEKDIKNLLKQQENEKYEKIIQKEKERNRYLKEKIKVIKETDQKLYRQWEEEVYQHYKDIVSKHMLDKMMIYYIIEIKKGSFNEIYIE